LLGTDNVTIAEAFRDAGYKTAIFGKWHLGENYPFRPVDRGFQESIVHGGGGVGSNPDYAGNDYFDDTYRHNGVYEKFEGYCNTVWFTQAMKFIKENREDPFFCYVATNVPHAPLLVDSSYSIPYRSMVPDRLPNYYGMVTKLDEDLGIFLNELEEIGLADNTILIFMTDNGPCPWFGGIIIDDQGFPLEGYSCGMRGGKIWGYENAHRVPCYIRWPAGGIGGGMEIGNLTAHMDLFPTLLDWCGLETPENAGFDGISLNSLLREPESEWPERTLFVHNQRVDYPVKDKEYQVMTERWRLLSRDSLELYDIIADPGQKSDLSNEFPEVVNGLKKQYEEWWDYISEDFDEFNPIILGNDKANPVMLFGHDRHRTGQPEDDFWFVEIEKAGKYRFTPYLRPKESGKNMAGSGAVKAVLKIGDKTSEFEIDPENLQPFIIDLDPGDNKLGCWLETPEKSLNLYSLEINKLAN
jgi:arylsulfatase A-like enzyme